MDPDDLLPVGGKKPGGVVVPDIRLGGKGHILQVGQGLDLVGVKAGLVKFLMVEGDALVAVDRNALQSFQLKLFQLRAWEGLHLLVKKRRNNSSFLRGRSRLSGFPFRFPPPRETGRPGRDP